MKAPEEIELNTCTFSDIGLFDIDEEEVTYIRKDTLMEWLKERYNSTISNVGCYTGNSVWKEVIEKLESL